MNNYSVLIKPSSSLCNASCTYCFYEEESNNRKVKSYGFMNDKTMENLVLSLLHVQSKSNITFAFQGGEPTLIGLEFYQGFVNCVVKNNVYNHNIVYSIQTNGMVIDSNWCRFFKKYNFLVGLSVDGYKENHDMFRLTKTNQPTHDKIMNTIKLLKKYNIEFNILTVLTKQLAANPKKLYMFYKKNELMNIQIIPCMNNGDKSDFFELTPFQFYEFYQVFIDLWILDFKRGFIMSVGLIDNIIGIFKNQYPYICGMIGNCSPQIVVESNGDVFPCDFYALDEYCAGNINNKSIEEIINNPIYKQFVLDTGETNMLCSKCRFIKICNGQCKKMRKQYIDGNYCGYQELLEYCVNNLLYVI